MADLGGGCVETNFYGRLPLSFQGVFALILSLRR